MFKIGDWIWGIDERFGKNLVANLLVVGDAGDYHLCFDSMTVDELSFEENMNMIYDWYKRGDLVVVNMIKKENTFATEQEAREALEAME